jgi:hypothetical protein
MAVRRSEIACRHRTVLNLVHEKDSTPFADHGWTTRPGNGCRSKVEDANNHFTTNVYDANGRTLAEINAKITGTPKYQPGKARWSRNVGVLFGKQGTPNFWGCRVLRS